MFVQALLYDSETRVLKTKEESHIHARQMKFVHDQTLHENMRYGLQYPLSCS